MSEEVENGSQRPGPVGPPPEGSVNYRAAPPDGRVLAIVVLFIATAAWFGLMIVSAMMDNQPADLFNTTVFMIVGGLIVVRWLGSVRGYTIEWGATGPADTRLIVRRMLPAFNVKVPLDRLRFVYPEPNLGPLLNTSILSQGALFGWVGTAQVQGFGMVQAYATNNKRAVVLEFSRPESRWRRTSAEDSPQARGPVYVLSPADPEGFATELRRLPGVGTRDAAKAAAAARQQPAAAPVATSAAAEPAQNSGRKSKKS